MVNITNALSWSLILMGMVAMLYLFFKYAGRLGLIAIPEERSSHRRPVIKAAGFIIPFGVVIFTLIHGGLNGYILTGLILLSVVSFADDMGGLSATLRLGIQCIAAALIAYWLYTVDEALWFIALVIPWCIGHLNASNFMDGINGMLILNMMALFIVYATAGIIQDESIIDTLWLIIVLLGVLAVLNVRTTALCFLGDVGSISLGWLSFATVIYLVTESGQISLLFSMAVFYTDSGLTLLHRIWRRENILQPHREHLYEILYNDEGKSPILISLSYMGIQLLVNMYLFYLSPLWRLPWWLDGLLIMTFLMCIYFYTRYRYIKTA